MKREGECAREIECAGWEIERVESQRSQSDCDVYVRQLFP